MRLLIILSIITFCPFLVFSQDTDLSKYNTNDLNDSTLSTTDERINIKDIEVSFLSSYYQQDGKHSPVTGGIGTEELRNIAPSMILYVPIDTVNTISFEGGIDAYSSASSDNIDNPFLLPDQVSSASAADARYHTTVALSRKNTAKRRTDDYILGFSYEYDVTSFSLGYGWTKQSKDKNKELSITGMTYYDLWERIYPIEFRDGSKELLSTNKRQSYSLSLSYFAVVNKRMNVAIISDIVYQSGLLSTPFHRVYFGGVPTTTIEKLANSRIEKLPDSRLKLPVGLRLNYYATDLFIVRLYYRYYFDSFGITANTASIEIPLKLIRWLTLYPFYRYHNQTATDYFKPYGMHDFNEEYYTSDYDLSAFISQKTGIGVNISPLYGITRTKFRKAPRRSLLMFKSVDLRYANYKRSDGFKADVLSAGLNFAIQ